MERLPFQVTRGAEVYDALPPLPVCVVLHDIRSMYNVGAILRTADAAAVARLYVAGISPLPTQNGVAKTALGAEETVPWEQAPDAAALVATLRERGHEIAALETAPHAVDLFDWKPRFPVCLLLGNEVDGLPPEILATADVCVRIPMLGVKHSLNVATAAGVVLYELLRKYRNLHERAEGKRTHDDLLHHNPNETVAAEAHG
ncbi:MAG: RNA methyltransferase [Bryobacterales bacterium]|nr:RNA methyltransferase [Bryobacterales bacterium]